MVTLAVFMEILDTTIVNVALPHVAGSLSASYDESTWVLTSYLVANGIVLPISAFLSRLFGRKQFFLICIVMFTICSFLCGIATELWQIILFRVMQGFFGGGLQPTQQSVLLDYFKPEDRGKAFGLSSIAIIVAPVLGPTLGGWITDNYSWRWVFFINIPVGIVTVLAIYQLLEDPPWEKKSEEKLTVDWTGIGLIALGLGCLQVMLDRGEDDDWFYSNFIRTFAVLTLVGIIGAIYWLMYAKKPVVDLHCMKDRNFAISSLLMAGMAMILYGSSVVIPQLAQQDLGYTATWSGLVLSPGAVLIVLTIPLVLKLMPVVQTRWIIAFGFTCLAVSFFWSRTLTPDIDFETLVLFRSAQSIGLGFLFVPSPPSPLSRSRGGLTPTRRRCLPCSATWPARLGFRSRRRRSPSARRRTARIWLTTLRRLMSSSSWRYAKAPRRSRTSPLRWAIRPALPPGRCTRP